MSDNLGGEQASDDMAAFAESIGESELYNQVTSMAGEDDSVSDGDDNSDDNDIVDSNENAEQEESNPEEDADSADDTGDSKSEKKPWDIRPERPEILDSEEFQSFLQSSGKTEEDFIKEVRESTLHTIKIRGKEQSIPYEKLVAEAQMAGASRQKSQRMNAAIADGRMVAQIRNGGEGGKLALKALLQEASSVYNSDMEDLADEVLGIQGEYDSESGKAEADVAENIERFLGDVVDNPDYNDNMEIIRNEVEGWLPKDIADEVSNDFESLREFYDIVSSPAYPEIRQMMEQRLAALPSSVESSIRSNAENFRGLFEDTINEYTKSLTSNQREQRSIPNVTQPRKVVGNSKTVSPPRNTSGKRVKSQGANADNIDFLSMSREELNGMLSNYR